ncbi:MAG: protein-L-isoaspartate(D-aspartate) O-methyltransferase [Candidatus Woesearchaeota archaeon]
MGNAELIQKLREKGITDENVLEAMLTVPREKFIDMGEESYLDIPMPIGHGQTISQPFIVALMTSALHPKKHHRVLEIGTGSGYQAAVLSQLVSEVYTVERIADLAEDAQQRLDRMELDNVSVKHGDGHEGWPEKAPFNSILLTAAPENIPERLIEQLKDGGVIIAPVGAIGDQRLVRYTKIGDEFKEEFIERVRFVPMV